MARHARCTAGQRARPRVQGGEARRDGGWEYPFEYPVLDEQPSLDAELVRPG